MRVEGASTEHRDGEPVDFLLVEAIPGDLRLTKMAFDDGCIGTPIRT